jgi:sec-independent protein translocase protein TatB
MFDIGWTEMVVLGVVALLVLGPRELPNMLRTIGRYVKQARTVAGEFRAQLDDISNEIDAQAQLKKMAEKDLDVGLPDLFHEKSDATKDKDKPT